MRPHWRGRLTAACHAAQPPHGTPQPSACVHAAQRGTMHWAFQLAPCPVRTWHHMASQASACTSMRGAPTVTPVPSLHATSTWASSQQKPAWASSQRKLSAQAVNAAACCRRGAATRRRGPRMTAWRPPWRPCSSCTCLRGRRTWQRRSPGAAVLQLPLLRPIRAPLQQQGWPGG